MTRPGDPGRRQIFVEGDVDVVAKVTELVGSIPGAVSFELSYDTPDRTLTDGEEPRPDERVRWQATAVIGRKLSRGRPTTVTYVGEAIVEPGEDHGRGGALAAVDLAEKLGANVVVLDMGDNR